jgi:hypothetical protein
MQTECEEGMAIENKITEGGAMDSRSGFNVESKCWGMQQVNVRSARRG